MHSMRLTAGTPAPARSDLLTVRPLCPWFLPVLLSPLLPAAFYYALATCVLPARSPAPLGRLLTPPGCGGAQIRRRHFGAAAGLCGQH